MAARKTERAANSEVAALRARVEALRETLRRGVDATAAVLADPNRFRGVAGPFAGQLSVADGYQTAIAAALGAAADAITVRGLDAAARVLAEIRAADAGTLGLVIAAPAAHPDPGGSGAPAAASPSGPGRVTPPALPQNARWAVDLVTAPGDLAGAVRELLAGVIVVADLGEAAGIVRDNPDLRAVTVAGDLLGAHWAHGGSARPQSLLDVRAASDEAASRLVAAELREEEAAEVLALALEAQDAARQALEDTRGQMQAADAAAAEISGRLGRLAGAARAAADEAKRLDAAVGAARRSAEKDLTRLAELKSELALAQEADARARDPEFEDQLADDEREEMAQRCTSARNAEMEARLEVRTVEERLRAISGRADSLSAAAAAERTARERAAARRRQRSAQAAVAKAVTAGASAAVAAAESSLARADSRRREAEAASAGGAESLKAVRARVGRLSAELDTVVNTAHGAEIARAEHRLRLEQLAAHAVDEFGVQPDVLVAEYGPDQPVPAFGAEAAPARRAARAKTAPAPSAPANGAAPTDVPANGAAPIDVPANGAAPTDVPANGAAPTDDAVASEASIMSDAAPATLADALRAVRAEAERQGPGQDDEGPAADDQGDPANPPPGVGYVREEQEQRAAAAERQLARLGKVNPLALEEYAALQERHQFLATQLEDLRKTRRDLLTVVKEVDDRVQEVFASAYADTAREFEGLFARLFPGGSGRLLLTEPDDMLTTGIEIEARPPGKKVKRLSLLSGGERSLTAIAYLFAIFKARPSPFYVLDEVEAALDDSNLQRLLGVFEELRESSQLIVITHQRRTMEAADALYGVTMRGDGVSTVISQRVREHEPA